MIAQQPFISVITPFYNTAPYLDECIRSVLGQSHEHFEYILLDNCSTDGSADIARSYAERDPRIRYIKASTFVGQVENYNRALREISPESRYCKMVQADDWIFPNCLKEMAQKADRHPDVGLVGAYSLYDNKVGHDTLPFTSSGVFPGRQAMRLYLESDRGFLGSPTCVLFRSDLVRARSPFFSADRADYEDVDACFALLDQSNFGFVYQILTFNRRDNISTWTKIERLDPYAMHTLVLLIQHGPAVFDPPSYARRLSEVKGVYYDLLARGCLRPWDRNFWEYHVAGLKSAGLNIDTGLLAKKLVLKMLNVLANPKLSFERLLGWVRTR